MINEDIFLEIGTDKAITRIDSVNAAFKNFVTKYEDMNQFREKYYLHESVIGEGAYGQVKKATLKKNGEIRAIKIIKKWALSKTDLVRLLYEIDILKNLNHPNILRLYEIFEN